jgi:hypothetical protein
MCCEYRNQMFIPNTRHVRRSARIAAGNVIAKYDRIGQEKIPRHWIGANCPIGAKFPGGDWSMVVPFGQ